MTYDQDKFCTAGTYMEICAEVLKNVLQPNQKKILGVDHSSQFHSTCEASPLSICASL